MDVDLCPTVIKVIKLQHWDKTYTWLFPIKMNLHKQQLDHGDKIQNENDVILLIVENLSIKLAWETVFPFFLLCLKMSLKLFQNG